LSQYPDVVAAGVDPFKHYLAHGGGEGRDPHPRFETNWYLALHPEAAAVGTTPLQHYLARYPGKGSSILAGSVAARIADLRSDTSGWPPVSNPTAEAGIVISACGRLFKYLYANLRNIRERGCTLPVDVWHLPGEFTDRQIAAIGPMANFVDAGETPFNNLSGLHEVHGFKAWMLSGSRFQRTLMLDVNSFPVQNVETVFQTDRTCVLWRDGPWAVFLEAIAELRRALNITVRPFEFESGQLYVNKETAGVRHALRFAAALNTLGKRLYTYTHGDKETYSIAFDLLEEPFAIAPRPKVHCAGPESPVFGGVVQRWFDGSELFYHPLGDKLEWWRFKDEWRALEEEAEEAEKRCQ
jgi:hypothetical protein